MAMEGKGAHARKTREKSARDGGVGNGTRKKRPAALTNTGEGKMHKNMDNGGSVSVCSEQNANGPICVEAQQGIGTPTTKGVAREKEMKGGMSSI
jgi:hypothetical protein